MELLQSNEITISSRKICLSCPSLLIVEISINHKGGLGVAFEMMYAATKSDAEIIKCQDPYC